MKGLVAGSEGWRPALPVSAIVLLGILVYANAFGVPLIFDDKRSILENPAIRDWTDLGGLWRSNPTRFVLYFSLALNYRLGGGEVFGYHLVNLAIHLGAALLAYGLVRLIYASPWARSQPLEAVRQGPRIALLTALLFVAHPIQTQAVTYVVQRAESLAAFFYLLALVLYVKSRQLFFSSKLKAQSSKQLSAFSFWLSALFSAVLGLLTKETVASLPAALLLYELCFLRSSTPPPFFRSLTVTAPVSSLAPPPLRLFSASLRSRLRCSPSHLRNYVPLLPFCLLAFLPLLLSTGGELELPAQTGRALSRWSYWVTQLRVLVTYLRLFLLPIGQNLDYDYPAYDTLGEPAVLGSLLLLASLVALAAWAFRRCRVVSFALLWFFVTLSVTSSVVPILDVIYEHRLYLATLGYGLFLAYALLRAGEGWGKWGRGAALGVLCLSVAAYALAAHQRNRVWEDEVGLWRDCVAKSPRKARPHNNLGSALIEAGRYDEAVSHLRTAVSLQSDLSGAYYNLGLAYQYLQRLDSAIEAYRRAVALRPGYSQAHNNLGAAYGGKGWHEKAIEEYEKAVMVERDNAIFRGNLEVAYGRLLADYRKRLSQDPADLDLRHRLAALLLKRGDHAGAIQEYEEVLRRDPTDLSARNNLGFAYGNLGEWDRAIAEQRKVLDRDPDFVNAYYGLALAYEKKGRAEEAAAAWEEYLRRAPSQDRWAQEARIHLERLRGKEGRGEGGWAPLLPR